MADYCQCGGKYAQTLSVDAFTQQIRTFGNIARCVCVCVWGGGRRVSCTYVPKHIYYCVVFIGFLGVPAFYIG